MPFKSKLRIEEVEIAPPNRKWYKPWTWMPAKQKWRLIEPLVYQGNEETFTVPAGFETDFASVPRLLQAIVPATGRYTKAAVVHDCLYSTHEVSRKDADGVFRRIMKELGTWAPRKQVMWAGVRLFGWLPWKK